ncbi:MAG: sulfide:quinone oxidoreductase [Halioglobus sp.]|jgi:sulfide:quinone oxidoreductase
MKVVKLSDTLSVSEQIVIADLPAIAAAGFKVVINNRPDGEEPNQPTTAEIEAAASAAGLNYYYFPVTAQNFPGDNLDQMAGLIEEPQGPVLAFCRTGTRCTNLWLVSRDASHQENAWAVAGQLGYDLAMATRHRSQ